MPIVKPSLTDIITRVRSDFQFETGSDAARLPGRPERGFVKALAAQSWHAHMHMEWALRQFFIRNADDEDMLVSLAASFGIDRMPKDIAEQFLERIIAVETGQDPSTVTPLPGDGKSWHVAIPRKRR